jgi:methylmalonyl-CoA mutase cobalamin-binding domain/chain
MQQITPYQPKYKVRIVTAASLFDGHDAAINIMRRIIQATGVEVIHLGHDRSVEEVVNTAIQEDANAIALTSYQGGHNEYFKYMFDLLKERGAGHVKIFGGGGGVILPSEIKELQDYGITRIYSPDDGRELGLQGMINDLVKRSDFPIGDELTTEVSRLSKKDSGAIARVISAAENFPKVAKEALAIIHKKNKKSTIPVLGITGTGGSGKSSLVDELVRRFLIDFPKKTIGLISVDPSKRKTGGALLGDRIRMNAINSNRVYMRSLATRQSNLALSKYVSEAIEVLKAAEYDIIILETSGIGQSDTEILEHSDVSLYVMTPEFGAATQLEKKSPNYLFGSVRDIWYDYFDEFNFELKWNIETIDSFLIQINNDGLFILLTDWINNLKNYSVGNEMIIFNETETCLEIIFSNKYNQNDIKDILELKEDFNSKERDRILQRTSHGIIIMKSIIEEMAVKGEILNDSENLKLVLSFKKEKK